jgi:hypothetical protein
MTADFPERDWKILRDLKPLALQRFCDRVLSEVEDLIHDPSRDSHERYLELYKFIEERDKALARTFDALRRSSALGQLSMMRAQKLITDEEFSRFSETTREAVTLLIRQVIGE